MRRRPVLAGVAALAVGLLLAVAAGCGDSEDSGDAATATHEGHAAAAQEFEGGIISPRRQAPPLRPFLDSF